MNLHIINETNDLVSIILGIATDLGPKPSLENCIDPKTRLSIINNEYPVEKECINEIEMFEKKLKKYKIQVLRPKNILNLSQIFSRDIAFVIENKIFIPEIIKERNNEKNGIFEIIKKINDRDKIYLPKKIKVEGGDVILYENFIFIGYTKNSYFKKFKVARTNTLALEYIQKIFPKRKVIGFEMIKNDYDPYSNILHLDCSMQPIGKNQLILYPEGFKNKGDIKFLEKLFGIDNIIRINNNEMFNLNTNIFSINNKTIISNYSFKNLNYTLEKKGFKVEKINFNEISKFGGLFRCSTLPLERKQ